MSMESTPSYNFIDVLWAPVRALSPKRIFVMTFFLCVALVIFDIFTYLAYAVDREGVGFIWSAYGLLPPLATGLGSLVAKIIYGVGLFLSILTVMLGLFAVSAIEIEKLRGNPFLSIRESIRFAFSRFTQILLSELAIVLFMVFLLVVFWLFGLVGRVPYVGEWVVALFFLFPGFVVAMVGVFIFVVFQVSVILLPAVAAADRHGETFNAILETFSTVIRQPFRWVGYTAYSLITSKLAGFVYAYACLRAVEFSVIAATAGGGDKIERLFKSGLAHLPVNGRMAREVFNIFPGIDWSFSLHHWMRGGTDQAAGYLMTVMLFLIFASIIGYMLSVIATAQARGYVAIRYFKDSHRIGDEKPLFYEEEHVNPPLEGEPVIDGIEPSESE